MVLVLVIVYVFSIIAAATFACFQTSTVEDYLKLFAIYGASLSGFFTVIISYVNVSRQAKLSIQIEKIRKEFVREIEGVKIRFSSTNNAYTELLQAMNNFFNAMDVEKNSYSKAESKNADELLSNTSYLLERLAPECKTSFIDFHQKLRLLREKFDREKLHNKRVILWRAEKKKVRDSYDEFVKTVRKHHSEIASPS